MDLFVVAIHPRNRHLDPGAVNDYHVFENLADLGVFLQDKREYPHTVWKVATENEIAYYRPEGA